MVLPVGAAMHDTACIPRLADPATLVNIELSRRLVGEGVGQRFVDKALDVRESGMDVLLDLAASCAAEVH